jgi:hypothetical protein
VTLSSLRNINISKIKELESQFDLLYDQAIQLQDKPESSEYQQIKAELRLILDKKDSLLWG